MKLIVELVVVCKFLVNRKQIRSVEVNECLATVTGFCVESDFTLYLYGTITLYKRESKHRVYHLHLPFTIPILVFHNVLCR